MKKGKTQTIGTQLVNPKRQGTIIVGCPRLGTQYLQALCAHHAGHAGLAVVEHGEINHVGSGDRHVAPDNIDKFLRTSRPGQYQLIIMNHLEHKIRLLNREDLLADWHVIRVKDPDPYRWFWSWFLFLHTLGTHMMYPSLARLSVQTCRLQGRQMWFAGDNDQGHYYDGQTRTYTHSWSRVRGDYHDAAKAHMQCTPVATHHGSSRRLYESMLSGLTGRLPLQPLLERLPHALHNHCVSQMLPADEEVAFQDLPALENSVVRWQPNDYPTLELDQIFENSRLLADILDRWSGPWPGVFKENK